MKKAISVVLAMAMVFVLSLSVFAVDKPTDPTDAEAWTAYYTELITNAADPSTAITEILNDVTAGAVDPATALSVIGALVEQEVVSNETVQSIIESIQGIIGGGEGGEGETGGFLPDFGGLELPDISDIGGSLGSIFDTVFGALGGIFDSIFGGGDENPTETPTDPEDGDLWSDDGSDEDGFGDLDFNDNSLGDTTVFSVIAVAAVAGVALVLTRKKSKDDDAE